MKKNERLKPNMIYIDDKTFKQKKVLKLTRPIFSKNKVPISILFRNANNFLLSKNSQSFLSRNKFDLVNKKKIQKNSVNENSNYTKNQNSSYEKGIFTKFLNDSIPSVKYSVNQSSFQGKKTTNKTEKKYIKEYHKTNDVSYTCRKYQKYDQFPIINITKKPTPLSMIRKNFLKNKDYLDRGISLNRSKELKKKLKNVNSSFSQESIYNLDKKIMKDISSKNFLYKDSLINDSKELDSSIIGNKKGIPNSNVNRHYSSIYKENQQNKTILKYKFQINPLFSLKRMKMKEWSQKMQKMGEDMDKIIDDSANIKSVIPFSLLEKSKFDKKFQNMDIYEIRDNIKKVHLQKEYKEVINKNVFKDSVRLLEIVTEQADKVKEDIYIPELKEKHKSQKNNNKHSLLERFRRAIIHVTQFLRQRDIKESDLNNYKLITQSYTYPQTETLINAIKQSNYDLCCNILDNHKYIVLDFDYFYLTPLHWAVKNNFYRILPVLLDYGSITEACSFSGETPLHISVKNNYYDCACILLYYLASPFVKDHNGKTPLELTNDFDMENLLKKTRQLHYSSYFIRTAIQGEYIQSGIWTLMKEDLQHKLQREVFEYFKDKQIKDMFLIKS